MPEKKTTIASQSASGRQPSRLRKASNPELWSYLNRCLSFDPPQQRYHKLMQLLGKACGKSTAAFLRLSLDERDHLARQIYGCAGDRAECIFSLILALADLERFSPESFVDWVVSVAGSASGQRVTSLAAASLTEENLRQLGKLLGANLDASINEYLAIAGQYCQSTAQALWVLRAVQIELPLRALSRPGPWAADPRAAYLSNFLESIPSGAAPGMVAELVAAFGRDLSRWRYKAKKPSEILPGNFLPRMAVLVEGQTEAILLPFLSACLGFDLKSNAVAVLPAGGSNQLVRQYAALKRQLLMPIVVLFDADAGKQACAVETMLRSGDRLHILSGEIEDTFDAQSLVDWINEHLLAHQMRDPVDLLDLKMADRRTEVLDKLWRVRGLGDFDKLALAKAITRSKMSADQVPDEFKDIVRSISLLAGESIV